MTERVRQALVAVCLVGFLTLGTGWAQRTTGSLGGTVQDETGAVLPGAEVIVTNQATGVARSALSGDTGNFVVTNLPPGNYTVRIEMPGFQAYEQTDIGLQSATDYRQRYVMQIGQVTETVTVQGGTTLVSTVGSEQRAGVADIQVRELPNPNRNITNLLELNPAVTISGGDHRAARLNGLGRHNASYTMDGVESSGSTNGNLMSQYGAFNRVDAISIEGVQEVQVIKGVIPAEYGNTTAGQVNIITKSGGSEFHGTAFHMYQTQALNAQDPFLKGQGLPKPKLVYNQFGGSLGGPLYTGGGAIVDNAFFFFALEGYEERLGRTVQDDVPTQLARDSMLASPAFTDRERQLLQAVFAPIPEPNVAGSISENGFGGRFRTARAQTASDLTWLVKSDVHFSDGSQLAFTWNRLDPFFGIPRIVPEADRVWSDNNNRFAANYFAALGNSWNLESRWGVTRVFQARPGLFFENERDPTNPVEVFPFGNRLPRIDTPTWGTLPGETWTADATTWNLSQKIGYIRGNHSIKFGGSYRYKAGFRVNPEMPSFNFASDEDALMNRVNRTVHTFGRPNHNRRIYNFGGFIQDDWRVHRNVTLNLGVRYDFISNAIGTRTDSKRFPTGPRELINLNLAPPTDWPSFNFGLPLDPAKPFSHDSRNFGPRFGFNWDIGGQATTVLRGGLGVLFSHGTLGALTDGIQDRFVPRRVRFAGAEIERFGITIGTLNAQGAEIARQLGQESGTPIPFAIYNPAMEAPYTMNYTLGVQRELTENLVLDLDYVGSRGVKFYLYRAVNEPSRLTGERPSPALVGTDLYVDNTQQGVCNALQMALRKRFSRGLSYGMTYSFGRSLGISGLDIGARFGSDNDEGIVQEFFNPKLDRGRTEGDIEHNFTANWYWEIPTPTGMGPAGRNVLGGWSLSGIFRHQTGSPVGLSQSGARSRNRPDIVVSDFADARFDDFNDTLQFWNPDAFVEVPLGPGNVPIRPGNANRALISGPSFTTIDFSFGKRVSMSENVALQFRWDLINAFNQVNLGGPRSNVSGSRFGRIEGISGNQRVSQINLKILF